MSTALHATGTVATTADTWAHRRPALVRACAGEPTVLGTEDLSLLELIDQAGDHAAYLFDPMMDPDDYRLAEIVVEYLCEHHGLDRAAGGKRVQGVISDAVRYLIPAAVEMAQGRPGREGAGSLLARELKPLVRMLAGELPLPAATVAGDQLGRRGAACLWLSMTDAAAVTIGGASRLRVAVAEGDVATHVDVRSGADIVSPVGLRNAGLLIESDQPHGLELSTAGNVLRTLRRSLRRASGCGVRLRGDFELKAIKPLPRNRLRRVEPVGEYVSLAAIARLCEMLPVVGQVCVWIMRLTGLRISEVYGLHVDDYGRDERGRPYLMVDKQGGLSTLERDEDTGRFVVVDERDGTKTPAGRRRLHIVEPLAQLIESAIDVFHIDAVTGKRNGHARLVPGVGKDDASGQSTLRRWLGEAADACSVLVRPHVLRAALVTDLKRHGVEKRIRFAYLGHEDSEGDIQDQYYDLGVTFDEQVPVLEVINVELVGAFAETVVADATGTADIATQGAATDAPHGPGGGAMSLIVPTEVREQWGLETRMRDRLDRIEARLAYFGWRPQVVDSSSGGELSCKEVAVRLDITARAARALMRSGRLRAHSVEWGSRLVWAAWESDVIAFKKEQQAPTVNGLADELGLEYYQVWNLVRDLELMLAGRVKGEALTLTTADADAIRAEHARLVEAHTDVVPVAVAARMLDLPVVAVETLLRTNILVQMPSPDGTRHRYVERGSIARYKSAYPPPAGAATGEVLLPFMEAARALGLTRPSLSTLTRTRQVHLARKSGSRHSYVTASSALAWAKREGLREAGHAIERLVMKISAVAATADTAA